MRVVNVHMAALTQTNLNKEMKNIGWTDIHKLPKLGLDAPTVSLLCILILILLNEKQNFTKIVFEDLHFHV